MKVVICTGGFDPIHSGHVVLLDAAAKLGHKLIVGLDNNLDRIEYLD